MGRLRRAAGTVGTLAVGLLVGLAGLAGMLLASDAGSEPLDLDGYCEHRYGESAAAYRPEPADPDTWRCSAWRNGVWGLDPVDPNAACRWQLGEDARLDFGAPSTSERELACTV
jgi:hypothetical protein